MSVHRCFVPDASGPVLRLPEAEAHHMRHVLRLGAGDGLRVFDGRGGEWRARITTVGRHGIDVELVEPFEPVAEPPVVVTLAIGLLKGEQMSAVVRDATALGVSRIVPVSSMHVAVPTAARGDALTTRLHRIAAASAGQCGRAVVPVVQSVTAFGDLLATDQADVRLIALEPGHGDGGRASEGARPSSALVFVGPEGGWSEVEVRAAREAGVVPLSLGPRTLRAELAPTVALTTLWARWGWASEE